MSETNTERLMRIKKRQGEVKDHRLDSIYYGDVDWLIEQAEQVEKSKKAAQLHLKHKRNKNHELNQVWESREKMRKTIERLDHKHASEKYELERENKRYREALVFAIEELTTILELENLTKEQIAECAGCAYNKLYEALEDSK